MFIKKGEMIKQKATVTKKLMRCKSCNRILENDTNNAYCATCKNKPRT